MTGSPSTHRTWRPRLIRNSASQLAITLDRNPYANPQPYLDHLLLRTYPAADPQSAIRAVGQGVADLVGGLEPQEVDALQAIASNVSVVDARMFTNSFVSDVNVRLALVQAVDRQRIVTEVLAGKADPDSSPIPVGDWAFSAAAAALHPYDPVAAAQALDKAGWVTTAASKLRMKSGIGFAKPGMPADGAVLVEGSTWPPGRFNR